MREYFGKPIQKLGFGLMRLPELPGTAEIDIERVKEMVDVFFAQGYSYFDTAYVYHNGTSETAFRTAVTERYPREAFQLTTKLPLWGTPTLDGLEKITQEQLERTGLDFFDLYFIHGIGPGTLKSADAVGAWDYLRTLKETGKTRNIGFSYHGDAELLNRILEVHAEHLDIVQLQINYLDWESADVQARACYEAVRERGLGVIVMEPIRGGRLASFAPEVATVFEKVNPDVSLASWALRFALELEGVVAVLSGMSNLAQLHDNLATAANFKPLNAQEMATIQDALVEIGKVPTIPCTACRYCVPDCPQNIDTPAIIDKVNEYRRYRSLENLQRSYVMMTGANSPFNPQKYAPASACIACGSCEEHCPQNIDIIEAHKEAVTLFGS